MLKYNPFTFIINKKPMIRHTSLNLLKVKALKALFSVVILLTQKFINKNEEIPIISHPKIKVIQLPAHTKVIIDNTNSFNKNIK